MRWRYSTAARVWVRKFRVPGNTVSVELAFIHGNWMLHAHRLNVTFVSKHLLESDKRRAITWAEGRLRALFDSLLQSV